MPICLLFCCCSWLCWRLGLLLLGQLCLLDVVQDLLGQLHTATAAMSDTAEHSALDPSEAWVNC
jgi:hypothetical protein